jgi:hypothetical protein
LQKGENAIAAGRQFTWTVGELTAAAQARYDAEYLLLRPGLAPAAEVSEQLSAAERDYDRVLVANQAISAAHATLEYACQHLPMCSNSLPVAANASRDWIQAIKSTLVLYELMSIPRSNKAAIEDIDLVRAAALQTERDIDALFRPWTGKRLDELIARAARDDAQAADWVAIKRALTWPGLSSSDRQRIWAAFNKLSIKLAQLKTIDRDNGEGEAGFAKSCEELAVLQRSIVLLQLAGIDPKRLEILENRLHSLSGRATAKDKVDPREIVALRNKLNAEYQQIAQGKLERNDVWSKERAAAIVPVFCEVDWLDTVEAAPCVGLRRQANMACWRWLAAEYLYLSHDDTTQLYSELARRYAEFAGGLVDQFVRFDSPQSAMRPSSSMPQVRVDERWSFVGMKAEARPTPQVLSPDGIRVRILPSPELDTCGATLLLTADPPEMPVGRGVVVILTNSGRSWHQPILFESSAGTSLDVLVAPAPEAITAVETLRLRTAATPQPIYLFVTNPTSETQQVVVEVDGIGQTTVSVTGGQTSRVVLPPSAEGQRALPTLLHSALTVVLRDPATNRVLLTKTIPIEVTSPPQYVRVTEARFDPGNDGKNCLSITLAASQMPPGPPCMVELVLSPEQIPGLVSMTGGRLRGALLPDGTPLTLTAEGLQLIDGAEESGEFSLKIDGVARAMTFVADFARRGDTTIPRQVARPAISLAAPAYALAGPEFRPVACVSQGPASATVAMRVGQTVSGLLVGQLTEKAPTPRETIVNAAATSDGAIALNVAIRDWTFSFDATGMVGPRTVEALLADVSGRHMAVARQTVIFDGTPADNVTFVHLPREVLVMKPIDVNILAADDVSGIDKVFVFLGKPVDGIPPAGAKLIEARQPPGGGSWMAQLPPCKEIGVIDLSVQAVNHVGLTLCTTQSLRIVDALAGSAASIAGVVVEGPRPQSQLTVELRNEHNAVISTAKTDSQGAFFFGELKPGKYNVVVHKSASQRRAQATVALEPAQSATVELSLAL